MLFNCGDRVRLVLMTESEDPIEEGTEGSVLTAFFDDEDNFHICVVWDCGRTMTVSGEDIIEQLSAKRDTAVLEQLFSEAA